jgi:hypothetical protein
VTRTSMGRSNSANAPNKEGKIETAALPHESAPLHEENIGGRSAPIPTARDPEKTHQWTRRDGHGRILNAGVIENCFSHDQVART